MNLYQYAPNSLNWLDPLGLSCSYNSKSKRWHDNETGHFTKRPTRYRSVKYQIHGHGIDLNAQIDFPGGNAAKGPTVRITDIPNKNWKKQEVFTTDGKWKKFKGNENKAHIPLDGSGF